MNVLFFATIGPYGGKTVKILHLHVAVDLLQTSPECLSHMVLAYSTVLETFEILQIVIFMKL